MRVEHEGRQGALQLCQVAVEQREARSCHPCSTRKIHLCQPLAYLVVRLGRKGECRQFADFAQKLVVPFVLAVRHIAAGNVRQQGENKFQLLVLFSHLVFFSGDRRFQLFGAFGRLFSIFTVLLFCKGGDEDGGFVPLGLQGLQFSDRLSPRVVFCHEHLRLIVYSSLAHALVEILLGIAQSFDVVHVRMLAVFFARL